MAGVTYEHVSKKFGDNTVLKDINIQVEDKEFLVLVGPSGCGKSTALRCLAGLEEITSGRILIGEREVNNVAPKDRDIAMVFQSYALYPHMSVYDNMAFGLKLRKTPKAEIDRRGQDAAAARGAARPARAGAARGGGWPGPPPRRGSQKSPFSTSRSPTWTPSCAW